MEATCSDSMGNSNSEHSSPIISFNGKRLVVDEMDFFAENKKNKTEHDDDDQMVHRIELHVDVRINKSSHIFQYIYISVFFFFLINFYLIRGILFLFYFLLFLIVCRLVQIFLRRISVAADQLWTMIGHQRPWMTIREMRHASLIFLFYFSLNFMFSSNISRACKDGINIINIYLFMIFFCSLFILGTAVFNIGS